MKRCILAVSGGVDSVVLLDMLSKQLGLELIVAHFDHGIRGDSVQDAIFVENLAKKYKLPYVSKREELGASASEELARDRRYEFLRLVARKYDSILVTAHHSDDVVETIAINLIRGTGWRGLAVLDSDIYRPLTNMTKSEIIKYAKKHHLVWREDSTNQSSDYLRNRIRLKTMKLDDDTKRQLLGLWSEQKAVKLLIDNEVSKLVKKDNNYSRYFFTHLDLSTGIEFLRYIVDARLTRPQLINVLHAIKTMQSKKSYIAGNGVKISFTPRNFTVELIK
ncbi:MAG: tRNA lysidine(34) synthetase TilS [Candidatus Saccharibacteria bacterium]